MNNVVKQYLKECRRTFPFISKNEKLFFKRLEDNLNDIDENVTYKEICLKYGEPKNVMISYIENCDNEYILKRTSIKSIVKKIFITLFCILIALCATLLIYNQLIYNTYDDSNTIKKVTIIEEE